MSEAPERLFRDEAGAAVERAARLEDENKRLRAELDHLRRGGAPARIGHVPHVGQGGGRPPPLGPRGWTPPQRGSTAAVVIISVVTALLGAGTVLNASSRHSHGRHSACRTSMAVPPRTYASPPPTPIVYPPPAEVAHAEEAAANPLDECSPPYFYDVNGRKHYKAQCLGIAPRTAK